MTTFGNNEQYVPYCVDALAHFWPEMTDLLIFSDRGDFSHTPKIISKETGWVPMVLECLTTAIGQGLLKDDDFFVLLLEDHIPHDRIPHEVIVDLSDKLSGLEKTYLNLAGHGPAEFVSRLDGVSLHVMEFDWFSSLHPAIWSVRHLLDTLTFASEQGVLDPWEFETVRLARARHYTTGARVWPSPFSGFLIGGRVNRRALATLTAGPVRPLRRKLLRQLLRELPGRIWRRVRGRLSPPARGGQAT
jgi:hypothetical protein